MKNKSATTVRIILRILLIISTVLFVIIIDTSVAVGIISNAKAGENWPPYFAYYGYAIMLGELLLTAGTVLCLLKINRTASVLSVSGILFILVTLQRIAAYANESGFYSIIRDMPAGDVYRRALMPTLIVSILVLVLSFIQYFGTGIVRKGRGHQSK